jgi:hypothetical protein
MSRDTGPTTVERYQRTEEHCPFCKEAHALLGRLQIPDQGDSQTPAFSVARRIEIMAEWHAAMLREALAPEPAKDLVPDPYDTCAHCGSWHYTHNSGDTARLAGCKAFIPAKEKP